MSQNPDQHYIDKTIDGDTRSFSVLVDRYKYMVYTLAMKILKNKEEAEEVAQDVFVKVYQSLSKFKGDSKFSTWIYKIAYNRSLDYVKKNGRRIDATSIDEYETYDIPSLENSLDSLEAAERKAAIKDAMEELPEEDTIILTLHYFEELSLKEISAIMNISANTIKVRLFRGRKRLASVLQHKLEPEIIQGYGRK